MQITKRLSPTVGRRGRRGRRRAAGTTVLAAAALTLVAATLPGSASAGSTAPERRTVAAPNVFYPVQYRAGVVDRKMYRAGKYAGTQIAAPCGTPVIASHAGTVTVGALNATTNTRFVYVTTTTGFSRTTYTVGGNATVSDGQIVAGGQQLGVAGDLHNDRKCEVYFAVLSHDNKPVDATAFLNARVGGWMPETVYFGNRGFNLATFNVLGASHTASGGAYPVASTRMPKAVALLNAKKVDVAGLQELQPGQYDQLMSLAGGTYASFHTTRTYGNHPRDTENTIIWRKSAFDLVSSQTLQIPYFDGNPRLIPVVQLREKASGRSAWFINTHNPANTAQFPHQESYRAKAIAIERQKIIDLRASGLPVFLTGDLNDREAAFCPLTAGKLMLSADSVPSTTCAPPKGIWIDQILAAGPARFTTYDRDWAAKTQKVSDHPIVVAHTHLAPPA
ncbi:hypothetical protein GCM10011519_14400 [Marmoricola endophyticus]|uniref:Uncharacterized protein n=1 Tax=Marmoricola endophyticus TaxID=2040280 RepID=A0A917F4F2_9ACTN|nr:endonuclease/exonuclease/phosphatase family protein [Marmoricola endophyticus]GGF41712.1 hypothetical protein GCM10011519_14400 [Marmoricola endophyticus]